MATNIITAKQVTEPILFMLKLAGCHPKKNTVLTRIIFWIFCITGVIYTVASVIKCFQQKTLETFSITYIDFLVASQTTAKLVSLYVNEKRISNILDIFWNDFWPVNMDSENFEKYNRAYARILRYTKIYRVILFLCIVQISSNSLMLPFRALTYNFYYFGYEYTILLETPYYELFYIFECITLSVAYILCLVAHDMIYMALCGCTIVQFDMLKKELLKIGEREEEESYDILKKCVKHHNLLLKFVKDLERIVTLPILKQYLDAISCMGIYIYLAQQNFHFIYVFSLGTNLSQTLFFSSFGQMIQNRSLAIADAAYENKWHLLPSRKLRQALILVTLRAQRRTKISAGGFIFLSFESFVGMLKAAGSFLAVLRSTKD